MFVISPFGKGGFREIFLRLSLQIPPHPPLLKGGKLFVDKLLFITMALVILQQQGKLLTNEKNRSHSSVDPFFPDRVGGFDSPLPSPNPALALSPAELLHPTRSSLCFEMVIRAKSGGKGGNISLSFLSHLLYRLHL